MCFAERYRNIAYVHVIRVWRASYPDGGGWRLSAVVVVIVVIIIIAERVPVRKGPPRRAWTSFRPYELYEYIIYVYGTMTAAVTRWRATDAVITLWWDDIYARKSRTRYGSCVLPTNTG